MTSFFSRWARLTVLAFTLALGACATGPAIDRSYVAQGQDSRVQFLILHYTVLNFPDSLRVLTQGQVSSHYLVSDAAEPKIYGLVDEGRRAWHAGPSHWKNFANLNGNSVGIEIVNPGWRDTVEGRQWFPYSAAQIEQIVPLVRDIVKRHQIRPDRILGHSDIQPQTKQDPGPLFPWKRLADEGLIPWPDAAQVSTKQAEYVAALPDVAWFQKQLETHGFKVPQTGLLDKETRTVISAFQMKYRPTKFDGEPDAETAALLDVINRTPLPKPIWEREAQERSRW